MTLTVAPVSSRSGTAALGKILPLTFVRHSQTTPSTLLSASSSPHILFIADSLHLPFGGAEHVLLKIIPRLVQQGFRVSLLTFSISGEDLPLHAFNCPVYLLPLRRTHGSKAITASLDLRRFLSENQVSIVQTFFQTSDLWAGSIAKTLPNVKLIWSRRDMGILRSPLHSTAYRLLANLPDAVLAVSEQVRQHCIEVDGIDPSAIRTIYNGLDSELWGKRLPPVPLAHERPVHITTVGNIRRVKGHDVLIRAAARVVSEFPDVFFTIAGDVLEPEYRAELQRLLERLDLVDKFYFLGSVSNLPRHLAQADLFVLPSRSEGLSNALLEAMAASLPVVATRVGGNAESVVEGATGTIVPPDDPQSMAKAIRDILRNPARARQMGEMGRQQVQENFSVEAMVTQTIEVYRLLLTPAL